MSDLIRNAVKREREARRSVCPIERHSSHTGVFRCELCSRVRREEQRRELYSEICIKCVEEAGFLED